MKKIIKNPYNCFGKIFIVSLSTLALMGCDGQVNELENKATQTFQNALKDSGLQETLESHAQKLEEFLDSNKTKEFIDKQTQILQNGADKLGQILDSNATKEILQQQMENLNGILSDTDSKQ